MLTEGKTEIHFYNPLAKPGMTYYIWSEHFQLTSRKQAFFCALIHNIWRFVGKSESACSECNRLVFMKHWSKEPPLEQ